MDILALILLLIVAFQAGKHYGYFKIVKIMKEVADEQGFDLEKELGIVEDKEEKPKDVVRKLKIDVGGDILYLFDIDTDTFICQANCVQDLAKIAKERSQIIYAVVKHGDKFFAFKDGESTEVTP